MWPDGIYIYDGISLRSSLKLNLATIKRMTVTLLVISTTILDIIWVSERQQTSQTAIRSDVMQRRDLFKSRLVFLCQKIKDTREFVIGIETACANWLGVTVACRQPASSSWATFWQGSNAFRVEAVHSKQRPPRLILYAHYSRRLVGNSRVDSSVSRCTRDHYSQEIQLFSK